MGKNVIWQEWRHKCEPSLGEAPLASISQEYGGLRQALLACRPTHTFKGGGWNYPNITEVRLCTCTDTFRGCNEGAGKL